VHFLADILLGEATNCHSHSSGLEAAARLVSFVSILLSGGRGETFRHKQQQQQGNNGWIVGGSMMRLRRTS
jgi:hypothetical protein